MSLHFSRRIAKQSGRPPACILTSKRVYKNALGHDIAKSIILGDSGSHFDRDVVDAFVASEGNFLSIKEHFAESQLAAA